MIGGGSAGALSVYLNVEQYAARLNPTGSKRMAAVPDCGFFQDLGESNHYHVGIQWIWTEMNAVVDPQCRSDHPDAPELCLFAEHISLYITVPIFALQAEYDAWQIPNILGSTAVETVQAFGNNLTRKLVDVVLNRAENGAMVDSCEHHCAGYDTYSVSGITQAQAVNAW